MNLTDKQIKALGALVDALREGDVADEVLIIVQRERRSYLHHSDGTSELTSVMYDDVLTASSNMNHIDVHWKSSEYEAIIEDEDADGNWFWKRE